MGQKRKNEELPVRKRLLLMEMVQKKRELQCGADQYFDPVRYIEHSLGKLVRGFEFHYDEELEVFAQNPHLEAVVDLTHSPLLLARESIMELAYRGEPRARFILCHEISHVLHHRSSAKKLARYASGSKEQYRTNLRLELEANLLGGTLLAPPDGLFPGITVKEIMDKFGCSRLVAERCLMDGKLFWRVNRGGWYE